MIEKTKGQSRMDKTETHATLHTGHTNKAKSRTDNYKVEHRQLKKDEQHGPQ